MNEEFIKNLMKLWEDPRVGQAYLDFVAKAQHEGLEAARKFWTAHPPPTGASDAAGSLVELATAFYSGMGFVPRKMYEEAVRENEGLKKENELLKTALRELNRQVLAEGSQRVQEFWKEILERQLQVSTQLTRELLGMLPPKPKA